MIELRGFTGKLNFDDNPYRVPNGDMTDALNITRDAEFAGQDETVTNIQGNQTAAGAVPAGTNKVIGNYADRVRNRQYFFTWNSNGLNRISYYSGDDNLTYVVMEDITDTGGASVLNFDPSYRINHIDIIYTDDGDLLFWTDGLNPPSKINVDTAITGGYGTIQRSFLDVAKEPPSAPPYCIYENDASVTINNLLNKQFKFKTRFVFDDSEKSVTSSQSAVPIPVYYAEQSTVVDPTKNSCILLVIQTGAANVRKIEVIGSESLGPSFGDFFLIDVLDKDELSIPDNDIYYYKFYNNKVYTPISLEESLQPFDIVPQKADAQSLPNGNVLNYGAITEGYDYVQLDVDAANFTPINSAEMQSGILLLAYQGGQPAFGTGSTKIIVAGIIDSVTVSTTLQVTFLVGTYPTWTTTTLSATATVGVDNITSVLNQFIASALAAGFTTATITGPYEITISGLANANLNTTLITSINKNFPSANSRYCYDWNSKYEFGVVYFDEKGRTNGVISSPAGATIPNNLLVETQAYSEVSTTFGPFITFPVPRLPRFTLFLNSQPPIWAHYFQLVRTKNLSKSNFLQWVSIDTLKDDLVTGSSGINNYRYAYISIQSLFTYIEDNPEVKALGYEFVEGDRIRFLKLYNTNGTTSQIYIDKDFQILSTVTDPVVNGVRKSGTYLKILLPPTDAAFDFGTTAFYNYLFEVYTPANNFIKEQNPYYEFGERYVVINPGTAQRAHQGLNTNQNPAIPSPSSYNLYKGDSYFRYRVYPFAGQMKFIMNGGYINAYGSTGGSLENSTSNSTNYTPISFFNGWGTGYPGGQISFLQINNTTQDYRFRIKGKLVFKADRNLFGLVVTVRVAPSNNIVQSFGFFPLPQDAPQTFLIDGNFTIPAGQQYAYIGLSRVHVDPGLYGTVEEFNFTITEDKFIGQGIVDPNLSDNYPSLANVDGRAWVSDPNAEQFYNPALIRFGGEYQQDSSVNNINRFYDQNSDTYDRSKGAIRKLFIEGRNQFVFQEFDVGVVTILTQMVRDTAANPLSAESDRLLNKIVYPYVGQFGIGDVPESFAFGKYAKYFVDSNKGVVCRLSTDGITPLSVLYKMNSFFVAKFRDLKAALAETPQATGTPTAYGVYDAFTNKYIIKQDPLYFDNVITQQAYTICFLDSRDTKQGFESFLSFLPENMGCLNNLLITFKDGKPWTHDNSVYCNFYNVQYGCSVQTVFNDQPVNKKMYMAIMQTANSAWSCPLIESQTKTYGNTPQQTSLNEARFVLQEGQYNSAILRDANSPGGIINGDSMKGNYLIVKFQKNNASSFHFINTVSLKYIDSPLNAR